MAALAISASGCSGELVSFGGEQQCEDGACESTFTGGSSARDDMRDRLVELMDADGFAFGQQRFNLTGVEEDGTQWTADGDLSRSDAKSIVGAHPAAIGIDAWDLAVKPDSWGPTPAAHAKALRSVAAAGGIATIEWHMRGCNSGDLDGGGFHSAGNEDCLCRLANDDEYAKTWLEDGKLSRLADALEAHDLTEVPLIFRPMHELTGGWFWWGYEYWDCENRVSNATVTGSEAYRAVYRRMVEYLRDERGLDALLFAYSPDKLWEGVGDTEEERYMSGYPGDAYVDVMGIDLYWMADHDFDQLTRRYAGYLEIVTELARRHGKIAALTETGNYRLADETTAADSSWYSDHLLPMIRDNANIDLAFVLVWENRDAGSTHFYVPHIDHPGVDDFIAFYDDPATLFLDDMGDAPPTDGTPTCASCDSDPDGDGWGWENEQSCQVPVTCN